MNNRAKIFKDGLVKKYLSKFSRNNISDFERKWKRIQNWRKSCIKGDLETYKRNSNTRCFFRTDF